MSEKRVRTLLLVEDNQNTRDSWSRDIEEFNSRPECNISFQLEVAGSQARAFSFLQRFHVDCAIIDLRIPATEEDSGEDARAESGNDVLAQILRDSGIPTVVYSGYEDEVSDVVRESNIKIFGKRGGAAVAILDYLFSQENLMEAMAGMRSKIAKETARLFHQSIWPRWSKSWGSFSGAWEPTSVITRQVVAHVSEELGFATTYHPEEFYFVPPLKAGKLATGDLIRIDGNVHVLLNPRCNMDRCEYPIELTFAHCEVMGERWDELLRRAGQTGKQREKALDDAHKYATQGYSLSKHFIPMCTGEGPWLVEFDRIKSVSRDLAGELVSSRFATISPQFLPNLVQRYSAYLGRIGQPDLDCNILVEPRQPIGSSSGPQPLN